MALFKIEKGLAANLATNRPNSVEGYCYFTSDDGKFYIDISTGKALTPAENGGKLAGATRMPINSYLSDWAVRAYSDRNGNDIACTYGNRLSLSDKYTLKLIASDSTELGVITLPKDVDTASKFTSAQTIELTGAVTGRTSSQAGWIVETTLANNIVKTVNISDKAVTNEKLANSSITIGGKTVNLGGTLTLADIGLNTALRFIGATSTAITDGSTTSSIVINGSNVTPTIGDVIINNNNSQEYVWLGSAWELLGDESSYALKTITISGSNGLTGSGTLSGNITLSHADTSNQDSISASGRRYITGVTLDTYGHVTGLTTGTETVTDTHYTTKLFATGSSGTAHDATTNGNTYLRLFDNNTARQSIKIVGSGATSVSSDENGVITISSTDNNTTYDSMSINEGTIGAETINRVLTAANLKGIINAHAPTKTGTGASGNWGINITGNATTATKFDTATNVTLTGDITGSSSSQKGWNIKTTIGEGKVTNAMLAGSISNDKLVNSYFTIKEGAIDHNISLGGQVLSKDLATWLGLSKIMSFVGISNDTKLVNGYTGTPTIKEGQTNYTTKTPGDTVLHETTGKQFIWTGSSWYEIGNGLLYDLQGTAAGLIATLDVNDTDGGTNNFVSAVKQTDGKINVTHKALITTGKWAGEAGSVAWANITGKPSTFTPSEHTHNYAGSSSAGGSANSANKLATARTIGLDTGVTSTATSFNGSSNITIPVTSIKESYLSWGGKNFAGSYGCIDAAMVSDLGANRLMFGKAAGITIQYSTDSGSTWTDYGASNSAKVGLFSSGYMFNIGKATKSTLTTNCMLRVIINTDSFGVYTVLNKFVILLSTAGCGGCYCTIDASLESSPTTFTTFANKVPVSGWSGYNVINTSGITTYGNSPSNQYGLIRFTFGCTSVNTNYTGLSILQIMGFGGVGWSTPSTMAKTGHLYSYDSSQNATFPAKVTATTFSGTLSGNASSASKLATARTISLTGSVTGSGSFDGSGNLSIATTTNHSHNYAGSSSAGGAANSVKTNLIIKLNSGTTEGTNLFTFNGSTAKTINITPASIGAAAASHGTHVSYGTSASAVNTVASAGTATTVSRSDHVHSLDKATIVAALGYTPPVENHNHDSIYVKKSGDTMTGTLNFTDNIGIYGTMGGGSDYWTLNGTGIDDASVLQLTIGDNATTDYFDIVFSDWSGTNIKAIRFGGSSINSYVPLYGAVWNDYAEFRICNEKFKPGQVVLENGDDTLSIANKRLQRGCSIVSDTFGFAIGETDEAKCPIAVSGRVLAYGYESREEFKKHIGWPVCSGPNGTVSIMTEEEEEKYPSRIIGTISAVPDYETWGTGNVKVNNRIWIKVK